MTRTLREFDNQALMTRVGRKSTSRFATKLLAEWKRLSLPFDDARVVVAVSGGADSVALLLALDELLKSSRLHISLTVAHLEHGLRAESEGDARWVEELAQSLGHEFVLERARVQELAVGSSDNLEQAARRARYRFFARTGARLDASVVVTAHTLDDQAETVILRLLRGSGAEGLGGMEAVRPLNPESSVLLARPLLNWAGRAETESFCRSLDVEFLVDSMNEDERFSRVLVRKRLLPLMQGINPRAVKALARTAHLLREDARALNELAAVLLEEAREGESQGLSIKVLRSANLSLRRRALRLWLSEMRGDLRRLEMAHLVAVERLLAGERGGRVIELPGGFRVSRRKGRLFFHVQGVENGGAGD